MTPRRGEPALEVVEPRPALTPPPLAAVDVAQEADQEPQLGEYLDVLAANRWLVAAAVVIALLLGGAYAFFATPVYRSDVVVQVEDKKNSVGGLADLSELFGESSPAETEIEILRSRALVGAVVDALRLDIVAQPRWFPLVGGAAARRWEGEGPRPAVLGLRSFAWGGEKLAISRLSVPSVLEGESLRLVAGEGGAYELRGPEGRVLQGRVGATATGAGFEIQVTDLVARPGTQFRVMHVPRDTAIEELQDELRIAEKGKKTGIIQASLDGAHPAETAAILDTLARAYLRQNVERKSAEAEKTLEFLETQLPTLRKNLETAERALEVYRASHATMDVSMEAQAMVTRAGEIEKSASELQVEYAALRQKFTEAHPAIQAIHHQLDKLAAERNELEARLKRLPATELDSAKLLRDVKVANELYLTLLNRAQELKVVREGTIGNVRILDSALVPLRPVAPRKGAVVGLAAVLGLALGVGLAFVRRALDHGVEDPDEVERATGVGVHAAVPNSPRQEQAARRAARDRSAIPVLAEADPRDIAVESLRSLRTSLEFALLESRSNVVAIGGPAPGVGKSFVSVNLAHLLGEAGKRVVIVDADLRRGHLHRYLGGERASGLSDVIGGHVSLADALRDTHSPTLKFLSTGTIPPNPAELLGSDRFRRVLAELSSQHDLVLVDAPPALAVADAAIIARAAGVNLLVVKSGKHPIREIVATVRLLGRNGAKVHGFVVNDVRLDRGLGRRNAYHYQYRYD